MPTKIEWTDEALNLVTGCTKVSEGCANCYAERDFHRPYPGREFTTVRMHSDRLDWPLRWRLQRKIFVCSMGDLFHEDVPFEFIDLAFSMMVFSPQHTFQILTKRPRRMLEYFQRLYGFPLFGSLNHFYGWGTKLEQVTGLSLYNQMAERSDSEEPTWKWPLPNVWLGVSVENQETADQRIPILLQIPAAVLFISCEPLLEPIKGNGLIYQAGPCSGGGDTGPVEYDVQPILDWVIVGGESGSKARPMHPQWALDIRDQCQAAGVPFFFKGWGSWAPVFYTNGTPDSRLVCLTPDRGEILLRDPWRINMRRVGKKAAGRVLDGRTWDEFPEGEG